GENRAAEAAKKAISSPLLETSIEGAQGVLMNITGGTNLSLYEVQEAADIVASASDQEVNMIFGSVINEDLKDEIIVTVIATGFKEDVAKPKPTQFGQPKMNVSMKRESSNFDVTEEQGRSNVQSQEDMLDIPTFLRNRNRRR